jgi:pyruvate ferredoxin oxidoreductase beta subunit
MQFRGARYLHVLVPCPLGWGSKSSDTIRVARLATESGYFPVIEAERGSVVAATPIRRRQPVEEYLRLQTRYAHLFSPTERTDIISRIQEQADRNIERFGLMDGFSAGRDGGES